MVKDEGLLICSWLLTVLGGGLALPSSCGWVLGEVCEAVELVVGAGTGVGMGVGENAGGD